MSLISFHGPLQDEHDFYGARITCSVRCAKPCQHILLAEAKAVGDEGLDVHTPRRDEAQAEGVLQKHLRRGTAVREKKFIGILALQS
jgi:hypothetical protein